MIRFAFLLGCGLFPIAALMALIGPLRRRESAGTGRFYGALAILALGIAGVAALGRPGHVGNAFVALAVLLLAPSTGLWVALRSGGVRADPRLGFLLGPLGWLAGCALGIQAVMRFGLGG